MKNVSYKPADAGDMDALIAVGDELFDHDINTDRAMEFFDDERHHLWLAYLDGNVVGMASAIHYVHPDKEPAMFIMEVAVLEAHRNRGIARTLVKKLVEHGRGLDCREIWIATEYSNIAARKAYVAAG
ncbi:MAG: GNAT family N-acetyltransferase, partial [Thiotrichales bacterium]|nr:GNAT family N-acetyltransferase [Thiotrichales bacterium]